MTTTKTPKSTKIYSSCLGVTKAKAWANAILPTYLYRNTSRKRDLKALQQLR